MGAGSTVSHSLGQRNSSENSLRIAELEAENAALREHMRELPLPTRR
jgi:hypothetical protein